MTIKELVKTIKETELGRSVTKDQAYNGFYLFQHHQLPSVFKRFGSQIINKIKNIGFYEVTKVLDYSHLLHTDDCHATLYEYENDNKAIIHIHFPTIDLKVQEDHRSKLCYNIFMCCDLENEDKNIMYYHEISSGSLGNKFVLSGYDNNEKYFSYEIISCTEKMLMEDITLKDIEERFIDIPN